MHQLDNHLEKFNNLNLNLSDLTNEFFDFVEGEFIDQQGNLQITNQETVHYSVVKNISKQASPEQIHQSYIVASIDLGEQDKIPTKSRLSSISRLLHKQYKQVPFIIVFRYVVDNITYLTFTVSELRESLNQKTGNSFVTKVVLLKDINLTDTHPAHKRILQDLEKASHKNKNFDALHQAWLKVLDTKLLGDNFYKEILEKYNSLVEGISLPTHGNPDEAEKKDFTLRLVGRLIFCWFLRAKGWIPQDLLSTKAIKSHSNYYHDVLESLFFESLNKAPEKRDFDSKEKFESVPYLNGGLFEAKTDDYYRSDKPEHFDRQNLQLNIPNQQIESLLGLFENYYFTIDENTSQTEEIGVDPEMMGRIFENFILNRSSTGSFYTPREIVDYMVETSLKQSLKSKLAISNNKHEILDWLQISVLDLENKIRIHQRQKITYQSNKLQITIAISSYVIAKIRGRRFNFDTKEFENCNSHVEIDTVIFEKLINDDFELKTQFIPYPNRVSVKQYDQQHKDVLIPKIGLVLDINKQEFISIWTIGLNGTLILDTIFRVYKTSKIAKFQQKNTQSLLELVKYFQTIDKEDQIKKLLCIYFDQQKIPLVEKYLQTKEFEKISWEDTAFLPSDEPPGPRISGVHEIYTQIITQKHPLVNLTYKNNSTEGYISRYIESFPTNYEKQKQQEVVQLLTSLKILDPACGSGAFPMGVLQKLTEIIHHLEPNKSVYEVKLELLQSCIYGVDLLPIAVEISRLRCWLSLVVDEDKNDPKPLPNLEFKFVCANSLVGIDRNIFESEVQDDLMSNIDILKTGLQKLDHIRSLTFQPAQNKQNLYKDWGNITLQILEESNKLQTKKADNLANEARKISGWNPFTNHPADFFDPQWMFGVKNSPLEGWQPKVDGVFSGGFDLIIGNPPYVGEKGNKDTFEPLKKSELGKRFYQGKMDLFYFFFHLGLDILKTGGVLSFITTNYYITATGGTKLRNDIKERSNVLKLINFGELKIFESATGQHNLITLLQKKKPNNVDTKNSPREGWTPKADGVFAKTIITQNKGYLGNKILENIVEGKDPNTEYYKIPQTKLFDENGYVKLTAGGIDNILDKMLVGGERLGEVCEVNQGIVTGGDKINNQVIEFENLSQSLAGKGMFVLNDEEVLDLSIEKDIYKPFFKNSDIERYTTNLNSTQNLLFIPKIYPNEEDFKQKYPNTYRHLLSFKNIMIYRRKKLKEKPEQWFTLNRGTGHPEIFPIPKIVAPQRSKTNTFGYNETAWYAASDVFFITQPKHNHNLKFLLGVLNSKLIYKWLYYRGKRKGEMLELTATPLSEIPIPILDTPEKQQIAQKIESLVNQILEVKKFSSLRSTHKVGEVDIDSLQKSTPSVFQTATPQEGNTDTANLESQIDQLVFELYGLTDEEKSVVTEV